RGPVGLRQRMPAMERLLDQVDGRRPWRAAAAAAGVGTPPAEVVARLDRMGVAWTAPTLATSEPDGWVEVQRALGEGGEPPAARRLRDLADEFAAGGIEVRERALGGAEAV